MWRALSTRSDFSEPADQKTGMSSGIIIVPIGALAAASEGRIVTYALGSCIGLCLYDSIAKTGGLLHALVPDSAAAMRSGRFRPEERGKYVDTGVAALIEMVTALGAKKSRLTAKLYGGAQLFSLCPASSPLNIGRSNTEAALAALSAASVAVTEQQTGGTGARTIDFCLSDGSVTVREAGAQRFLEGF